MRKKILLVVTVLSLLLIAGCSPSTKEFSGSGMTVKLNESFVEKEVIQAPLYLESQNHIFMGMRESKTDLASYGISNLEDYIEAILDNHGKSATVEVYEDEDITYYYAYYTATVDREYGYMLFVMEGESYFYSMNFGCLESNLDKNKTQYHNWAKTVIVD
ncbi:hypothetical protein [Acholeplasma laidlawii]|uniref:hypothetical protein n=1 Tax=Acholeplasma laidlawii TaxID=2148 RepID=UPI0021F7B717|nr:hypothetical protein [Acholeplasma laidlawii]